MTPKEKCDKLIKRYADIPNAGIRIFKESVQLNIAKHAALIAVDEILILVTAMDGKGHWQKYYEEVKNEIEKL